MSLAGDLPIQSTSPADLNSDSAINAGDTETLLDAIDLAENPPQVEYYQGPWED